MVQRSGGLVPPGGGGGNGAEVHFHLELGGTMLMSNVNVALVLVLSACMFEIGDEKCYKNLANVVFADVFTQ